MFGEKGAMKRISNNMLITTTSVLDDIKIENYLGVVSGHIVAGTNLFSDFFASVSDIFGGRSESYKKQLNSIKREVIEEIAEQAVELGANAIIGLSIDMDELSGKGKSMFMITATGTAVKIQYPVKSNNKEIPDKSISNDEIKRLIENSLFINEFNKNPRYVDLSLINKNKIYEIIPKIITYLNSEKLTSYHDEFNSQLIDCLSNLPESLTKKYLYESLITHDSNQSYILEIINEKNLVDYNEIIKMLKNSNDNIMKNGILLLKYDKEIYYKSDIESIDEIIKFLKLNIKKTVEFIDVKKTFSSETVKYWICKHGHKCNLSDTYCSDCSIDQYGFSSSETHYLSILKYIEDKFEVLKLAFNQS